LTLCCGVSPVVSCSRDPNGQLVDASTVCLSALLCSPLLVCAHCCVGRDCAACSRQAEVSQLVCLAGSGTVALASACSCTKRLGTCGLCLLRCDALELVLRLVAVASSRVSRAAPCKTSAVCAGPDIFPSYVSGHSHLYISRVLYPHRLRALGLHSCLLCGLRRHRGFLCVGPVLLHFLACAENQQIRRGSRELRLQG
jgi:hypothetical protein